MTEKPTERGPQGSLRSDIGLLVLIFMLVGLNVGGGPFILTATAAGLAGP